MTAPVVVTPTTSKLTVPVFDGASKVAPLTRALRVAENCVPVFALAASA